MYIPDPSELMEQSMESRFDMVKIVDGVSMYPCCGCGRMFDIDTMQPISPHPDTDLECGMEDCGDYDMGELADLVMYSEKIKKKSICSQKGFDAKHSKRGWKIIDNGKKKLD